MIPPVRVSPPAAKPVALADAKEQCRVDGSAEDRLISGFIDAAVSYLDGWTGTLGRCLISQRWRQDFMRWDALRLPFPMAANLVVTYRSDVGTEVTVDPTSYWVQPDAGGPLVVFRSGWALPALHVDGPPPVSVAFDPGYGDAEDVPEALCQGILMLVAHWYANREAAVVGTITSTMPLAAETLFNQYRVIRL